MTVRRDQKSSRCRGVAICGEVAVIGGSTVASIFSAEKERKHPAYARRARGSLDSLSTRPPPPPLGDGADSHIKMTGVLVVPFRG